MELTVIPIDLKKRKTLPEKLDAQEHLFIFASCFIDYSDVEDLVERGRVLEADYLHIGWAASQINNAQREQVDSAYMLYLRIILKGK